MLKLLIFGMILLSLVSCVSSVYQVSDEDGTRTITISERQIVSGSDECNPIFMVKNIHDEWFIIDTYTSLDNIRLYNELKLNSTHLVQLYYDYYILDIIT